MKIRVPLSGLRYASRFLSLAAVLYFCLVPSAYAEPDLGSINVPLAQSGHFKDGIAESFFVVHHGDSKVVTEATLIEGLESADQVQWYGGLTRVANGATVPIIFELVRLLNDGSILIERPQTIDGPFNSPAEVAVGRLSDSNDVVYRRVVAKEESMRKQQRELLSLRGDAERVPEFAKLLDVQQKIIELKGESEDLEQDVSALEHFVRTAGARSDGSLARSRQQELTLLLGELSETVRQLERSEPQRVRDRENEKRRREAELRSLRGLDPEILKRELMQLKAEKARLKGASN